MLKHVFNISVSATVFSLCLGVRSVLFLLTGILVSCNSDIGSPSVEKKEPHIVPYELLPPSNINPGGLYRVQLEDTLFEVSQAEYNPGPKGTNYFDVHLWWSIEEEELLNVEEGQPNVDYGVLLQVRAYKRTIREHESKDDPDYQSIPYRDKRNYELRPSTEYLDLKEYYVFERKKAFVFLIDGKIAVDHPSYMKRIYCRPGFRILEKEDLLFKNNRQCSIGYPISPHVHIMVLFDSRILSQAREFERHINLIFSSFIKHNSRN